MPKRRTKLAEWRSVGELEVQNLAHNREFVSLRHSAKESPHRKLEEELKGEERGTALIVVGDAVDDVPISA